MFSMVMLIRYHFIPFDIALPHTLLFYMWLTYVTWGVCTARYCTGATCSKIKVSYRSSYNTALQCDLIHITIMWFTALSIWLVYWTEAWCYILYCRHLYGAAPQEKRPIPLSWIALIEDPSYSSRIEKERNLIRKLKKYTIPNNQSTNYSWDNVNLWNGYDRKM